MMKNPPHPGSIIGEDVLAALGLTVAEAAARLGGLPRYAESGYSRARGRESRSCCATGAGRCGYRTRVTVGAGQPRPRPGARE